MRRGQIKLEDIKPGRKYYAYNTATGIKSNDIICLEDKRFYKRINNISTELHFNRAKRNVLINNSLPGIGKSWDSFVGYNLDNDGFFSSTLDSCYKSLPLLSNGRLDVLSYGINRSTEKGIFPQQCHTTVSTYWSNGMLYPNCSKVFENYLDAIESIIYDLEELMRKYNNTTRYIESSVINSTTSSTTKPKNISTDVYHDINDWKGEEVYLSIFNTARVSRIIDYFSFQDIRSVYLPPIKVKVLGPNSGRGYGIDFITENGSIIKDLYVFSSEIFIHETEDESIVNWEKSSTNCLISRESWKEYANDILEKYKTVKEKGGRKLKEYDITQFLYYS